MTRGSMSFFSPDTSLDRCVQGARCLTSCPRQLQICTFPPPISNQSWCHVFFFLVLPSSCPSSCCPHVNHQRLVVCSASIDFSQLCLLRARNLGLVGPWSLFRSLMFLLIWTLSTFMSCRFSGSCFLVLFFSSLLCYAQQWFFFEKHPTEICLQVNLLKFTRQLYAFFNQGISIWT